MKAVFQQFGQIHCACLWVTEIPRFWDLTIFVPTTDSRYMTWQMKRIAHYCACVLGNNISHYAHNYIVLPRAYRPHRGRGHVTAMLSCVPSKIQMRQWFVTNYSTIFSLHMNFARCLLHALFSFKPLVLPRVNNGGGEECRTAIRARCELFRKSRAWNSKFDQWERCG